MKVKHCTAAELLSDIESESVDLIVTDPPYGIGYLSGQDSTLSGQPRRSQRTFGTDIFDPSWLTEAFRVLKPGSALYLFTRWDVIHQWKSGLELSGLKVRQRIVWDKALWGMGDLRYFGSQCEDILFCTKGLHKLRWDKRMGNCWRIGKGRILGKDGARHPTQKPVDLLARIILLSSAPGDLVLDPFCGSGSTLVAAQRYQRRYLGCDVDMRYVAIAREWLEEQSRNDPRCHTKPLI